MSDKGIWARLRATAFFGLLGSGITMFAVLVLGFIAFLFGDTVTFSELISPLLVGGAVGGVGGVVFAGAVQALGRRASPEGLSYSRAIIAGALGMFFAPLVVGLLFFSSGNVPLLTVVSDYFLSAWTLLGIGGGIGAGLNGIARRKHLTAGTSDSDPDSGSPELSSGRS